MQENINTVLKECYAIAQILLKIICYQGFAPLDTAVSFLSITEK